jgi:uncharacterized protein YutE (UPF0331/DUF86 family)
MVRADVAEKKIARASAWLDKAQATYARPVDELRIDEAQRDLAAFYLFLAIQEAIDLAAHWVADAGWTPPDDVGSTFDVLAANGGIDLSLCVEMRDIVRVRNRIAHGYASVDHDRIHAEAPAGIASLRRFLAAVATAEPGAL